LQPDGFLYRQHTLLVLLIAAAAGAFIERTKARTEWHPPIRYTATPLVPQGGGYAYRRTITIDHTKVPNTNESNFPVLISGTYSYLATVSTGGNVQNANGYDVIFTSDTGLMLVPPECK
jgi:hypothetical protein